MSPAAHADLVQLLEARAADDGDRVGFAFLAGGSAQEELTYAQLRGRVLAVAGELREAVPAGGRALLLHPAGLDFIVGLLACAYARVAAVPVPSPSRSRARMLQHLAAVVADCSPHALLTTAETIAEIPELALAPFDQLRLLTTDHAGGPPAVEAGPVAIDPEALALIQYTSGSTSQPKGVMLTHGNLMNNLRAVSDATGQGRDSIGVSWLPHFHDMGLASILGSLHCGFPIFLMSPLSFLERPMSWLRAVTAHRATVTGGPNFAFDLCARRARPADRDALDLGSLQVVANGSEPVRADTIRRFIEVFRPAGLRPEAIMPCYGLAECVVFVSGGRRAAGPLVARFDARDLGASQVVPSDAPPPASRELVGCGAPSPQHQVLIVDPDLLRTCPEGRVGEIWIGGPSVARGYWNRPESADVFGASVDGVGPMLRTGDLGFLWQGQLFVTGRRKDLIILGGVNHYPQDIERTVEASHPALRQASSVAFSVDADAERLIVAAEALPRADYEAVLGAVRAGIAEAHGIAVHGVALLAPRTLSRTSSGKLRRQAARAAFVSGQLEALFRWESPELRAWHDRLNGAERAGERSLLGA